MTAKKQHVLGRRPSKDVPSFCFCPVLKLVPNIRRGPQKAPPAVTGEGHLTLFQNFPFLPGGRMFPNFALDVPGELLRSGEGLAAADADVAQGLGVLHAVSQQVQTVLERSAALAPVRALAPVSVPMADGEGGLPEDGAALSTWVGGLEAPARVQPSH